MIIIITNNITHNSVIKPLLCLIILACGGVVNRQGRKPLKHPEKKGKEEKGRSPKAAPPYHFIHLRIIAIGEMAIKNKIYSSIIKITPFPHYTVLRRHCQ